MFEKKLERRVYIASLLIVCLLSVSFTSIITNAALGTITITEQSFTETTDYVTWVSGSTYYVRDGNTGNIVSGSNLTQIIEPFFADDTNFHFKTGTYYLTARFLFRECDRITFEGEGRNTIFVIDDSASPPIGTWDYPWAIFSNNYIQDGSESYDITIKNLAINGNDDTFAEGVYHLNGIGIQNCWGLHVENVFIAETSGFACLVWSSSEVTIRDLHINSTGNSGTGNAADGLHIGGGAPHNDTETNGEPICGLDTGYGCRNVNIDGLYAYGTGDDSLAIFDSMYVNVNNVLITDSGSRGMEFDGNWYLNLNNFVINGSEYAGVQLETAYAGGAYNKHQSITNGKILNTQANSNMILSDSVNITVTSVSGFSSPNYGFLEAGISDQNKFVSCEVWDATTSGYGIIGDDTVYIGCTDDGVLQENSKWINYGTSTVASDEWVPHGLGGDSNNIQIQNMVGTYDGVPLVVTFQDKNSTHFQVEVFWCNGTEITDDAINIAWVARR